jgi:hypothetical protein
MTCETCKHYRPVNETEGACRRFPPQVSAPNYSQFPSVKPDWDCGEFELKPKAKRK